jgi:ribosomal protein L7/L12
MKLLLTVVVIGLALWALAASRRWKSRHAAMGRYPRPGEGTDADVERFLRMRRKMTAIKLYREIHGVDLKTAKEAVEEMARKIGMDR